jgi:hypothetical protein
MPPLRGWGVPTGRLHSHGLGGVKKWTGPVIPSVARNLHFFAFKRTNADASLSMTVRFFHTFLRRGLKDVAASAAKFSRPPCGLRY